MDPPSARLKTLNVPQEGAMLVAALALVAGAIAAGSGSGAPGTFTLLSGAALLGLSCRRCPAVAVASASAAVSGLFLAATVAPITAIMFVAQIMAATLLATEIAGRLAPPTPTGEQALPAARDRVSFETALVEITRSLLRDRDICEVEEAMAGLVRSVGCDLMMVCRNVGEGDDLSARIVYAAGATAGLSDTIGWSALPNAATLLSTGRIHAFGSVGDVPMPDRAVYQQGEAGIGAVAEFPIMVQERWVGHVGLFTVGRPHRWHEADLELLSTVADMVSAVWQRDEAVSDLEHVVAQRDRSLAIQTAITGSARVLFESGDEDIAGALDVILTALDGEAVYVREVRPHGTHGVGLETRTAAVAPGAELPSSLREGSWMAWPPVYAPILDTRPWIVADTATLGETQRRWYEANLDDARAEIAFPIVTGGTVVGMIGVISTKPHEWDAAEMRTLATIAQLLGIARTRMDARRNLEDIVRAKDRFIASVSHELRTPMAVVMGLSAELNTRRQDFSDEEVAEFIDLIRRQSSEVANIIEDLLVSARANAESITVLPEIIRLDEVVDDAISSMSTEQTRRISSIEADQVATYADPLRVRQIVRNLVTNGHRHGGARVFIRVFSRDGTAVLEVSDDGPGIPPTRRNEIFEAYTGGEADGRTASIGLGLTVSRQLARLMGGEVSYLHEPLPTFRLTLPVGAVREQADRSMQSVAG